MKARVDGWRSPPNTILHADSFPVLTNSAQPTEHGYASGRPVTASSPNRAHDGDEVDLGGIAVAAP